MGTMQTLSIGRHFAGRDIRPGREFSDVLLKAFVDPFSKTAAAGGALIP